MISTEDRFELNPSVVYTKLGEKEAALLHLETRQYYSLNETGMLIWAHLEQHHSVREMAKALSESYDIEIEEALGHVAILLDDLKQDGLILKSMEA